MSSDVNSIIKKDDNSLFISFTDKANFHVEEKDTIIMTIYPEIKLEGFRDRQFHPTDVFFKATDELSSKVKLKVPYISSPQDLTEIYITELITELLNLKYDTKFTSEEIFENSGF